MAKCRTLNAQQNMAVPIIKSNTPISLPSIENSCSLLVAIFEFIEREGKALVLCKIDCAYKL